MRIIETESGTEIYPLVPPESEVSDDDFCIAVDNKEIAIVDGRMWNHEEIGEVIEALEKALEVMNAS